MDVGGENPYEAYPIEVSWALPTSANLVFPNPKSNCQNGSENQFTEAIDGKTSFACWDGNVGTKGQLSDDDAGMYNSFLINNVETLNSIPCRDLLALADAAITNKSCDGGDDGNNGGDSDVNKQLGNQDRMFDLNAHTSSSMANPQQWQLGLSRYLFDLNSPPTVREPHLSTSISSQLTPVTPEQTRRAVHRPVVSDTVNSNSNGRTAQPADKQGERFNLDEQPQLIIEQSQATISTQLEVTGDFQKGLIVEISLNKTPQPKQRRRKHRPKVVIEGQTKRAKRSTTPKPNESSTGKRKYVRKITADKSRAKPAAEEISGSTDLTTVRQTRYSCRRKINFDDEQMLHGGAQATMQPGLGTKEKTQGELIYDNTFSTDHGVENYRTIVDSQAQSPITPNKTEITHERRAKDCKHTCSRENFQLYLSQAHDKEVSSALNRNESNCSTSACCNKGQKARGSKRERSRNENAMGCESLEAYLSMFTNYDHDSIPGLHFPAIYKKKRTGKGQNSATSSAVSSMWSERYKNCSFPAAQYAIKAPETSTVYNGKKGQQSYKHLLAFGHLENFRKKRTKVLTRVRDLASLTGMIACKQWPSTPNRASYQQYTCMEALAADFRVIATKKRTKRNAITASSFYRNHQFLTNHIGFHPGLRWKSRYDNDALTSQFERLDINCRMVEQDRHTPVPYLTRYQEKNALVLYRQEGRLVPYEGSYNSVRIRKPRPKVDLDDETSRVWRLLLEDINSQGIDGTDEEMAKWWEEERNVFHGRAASFIARMHLVQGDRRFSQWKGSVVDSVIGVFLTQNVSDHLSSSAFMSLAARYPLKSNSSKGPHQEENCQLDLDETIRWHEEKSNQQPAQDHGSMMLQVADSYEVKEVVNSNEFFKISPVSVKSKVEPGCEVSQRSRKNDLVMYKEAVVDESATHISGNVASITREHREVANLVSSQNSVDACPNSRQSSTAHTAERLGSCSVGKSEAELIDASKLTILRGSTSFASTMLHEVYCQEQVNEPYNKKIGQDKLESMGSSHEQNEGISCDSTTSGLRIPPKDSELQAADGSLALVVDYIEVTDVQVTDERTIMHKKDKERCASEQSGMSEESANQATAETVGTRSFHEASKSCNSHQAGVQEIYHCEMISESSKINSNQHIHENNCEVQEVLGIENFSAEISEVTESNNIVEHSSETAHKIFESNLNEHGNLQTTPSGMDEGSNKVKRGKTVKAKQIKADWDSLRLSTQVNLRRERTPNTMDSLDYEAVRCADVNEIADTIKERGMNNMLAERIKDFLNRLVRDHGRIDLEWLRAVPPDKAKEYLLSFRGLGLKSVECVRLLTLHHVAFPVDTNVGRIAVRLGWVPLQPLPESLQLHLLELYPVLESIQKYLWPRLCKLDQRTLYELHYQMITFGKVFCTKSKPNCNACPMRGECRHFASAFASARLALPAPEKKSIMSAMENKRPDQRHAGITNPQHLTLPPTNQHLQQQSEVQNLNPIIEEPATPEPIIEVPATPEPEKRQEELDIEDFCEDPEEIPMIKLNIEEFTQNLQTYMENNMELAEGDMSRALVALTTEAASIPTPKLKNVSQLRTEHHVYELPDSHPLLEGLDKREPDDPCSYLLAIWTPGETAESIQPPGGQCSSQESGTLCHKETCFFCNSIREANCQTIRGTLLIPCRTAMRGSFPLNGTYFQVNEVFADHDSSLNPIDVPRSWLWNLPRRTVYFGTSIPTIFKGLTTEGIQHCFWRGFVCVRGFDQKTRAPRPLMARLHFPASKLKRSRGKTENIRYGESV